MVGLDESEVLVLVLCRRYGTVSWQLDLIQKKASLPLICSALAFFLLILFLLLRHFSFPVPSDCLFPIAPWTSPAVVVLLAPC